MPVRNSLLRALGLLLAVAAVATAAAPVQALPAEPLPSSEPWRDPWIAAAMPLLGPATWLVFPGIHPISALWPYVSATGLVYAGEPAMALHYGLIGAPLPLAYFGAAMLGSCGRASTACWRLDATPFVTLTSLGLVGLMSYEGYAAVQRRRAGIRSEDPRGVPIAINMPLMAAASSAMLPPTLLLSPLPFMPPFLMLGSPLACGIGRAMTGDWSRAGLIAAGGYGVTLAGGAIGAQIRDPEGRSDQFMVVGALGALTAYSLWAGWDAYHAIKASDVVRFPPSPPADWKELPGAPR